MTGWNDERSRQLLHLVKMQLQYPIFAANSNSRKYAHLSHKHKIHHFSPLDLQQRDHTIVS